MNSLFDIVKKGYQLSPLQEAAMERILNRCKEDNEALDLEAENRKLVRVTKYLKSRCVYLEAKIKEYNLPI